MEAVIQSINLITINPAIRAGQPCIADTSLRVMDVVMAHLFHQRTPSEITSDYGISLAQVHAALAYYYEHKAEIDQAIRQQVATGQAYKEKRHTSLRLCV